jgi:REP element-mobilizing transposase RayT
MELPKRKPNRILHFDYSTPGAYFVTICTQDKAPLLSTVVGGGALDAPDVRLNRYGEIVQKYILSGNRIPGVTVDKYVIMPNHIHLILLVEETATAGTSRAPSPTNAVIPHFVSTLKRFCHRDFGKKIFQRSYHDHVIRNEASYQKIWQYIDNNPTLWQEDCFYVTDT